MKNKDKPTPPQTEAQKLGLFEKTYKKGVKARVISRKKLQKPNLGWTGNERVIGKKLESVDTKGVKKTENSR